MKTEQQQLAECRAHWEATKPDAVFPDYWLGWKAAREALVVDWPDRFEYTSPDVAGAAILDCITAFKKS